MSVYAYGLGLLFGLLFWAAVFLFIGPVAFLITLAVVAVGYGLCIVASNWGEGREQAEKDRHFEHVTSVREDLEADERRSQRIRVVGGQRGPDRKAVR